MLRRRLAKYMARRGGADAGGTELGDNAVRLPTWASPDFPGPESSVLAGTRQCWRDIVEHVCRLDDPQVTLLELPRSGARWLTIRMRNRT